MIKHNHAKIWDLARGGLRRGKALGMLWVGLGVLGGCSVLPKSTGGQPEVLLANRGHRAAMLSLERDGRSIFTGTIRPGETRRLDQSKGNNEWARFSARVNGGEARTAVVRLDRPKRLTVVADPQRPGGAGFHLEDR
jgi:hypothetical protein